MTTIVCAGSTGSLILVEHKISGRVNIDRRVLEAPSGWP